MHLTILNSSSAGNAAYIGNMRMGRDSAGFLIDAGVSRIAARLRDADIDIRNLYGVVYTHAHGDHFRPANYRIFEKLGIPQYIPSDIIGLASSKTDIRESVALEDITELLRPHFSHDNIFDIGEFPCCHDVPCIGYTVTLDDSSLMTWIPDTVLINRMMLYASKQSSVVCIECNYDEMLINGNINTLAESGILRSDTMRRISILENLPPHPPAVIDRIQSRGHLDTGRVLEFIKKNKTVEQFVLTHLSPRYQDPLLIRDRIKAAKLSKRNIAVVPNDTVVDIPLDMLSPDRV